MAAEVDVKNQADMKSLKGFGAAVQAKEAARAAKAAEAAEAERKAAESGAKAAAEDEGPGGLEAQRL